MKTILCICLLAIGTLTIAQTDLTGKFINAQLGLDVQVTKNGDDYLVTLSLGGQSYNGKGLRIGDLVMGTYNYNGNPVAFGVAYLAGQYYFSSEGQDIPIERTQSSAAPSSAPATTPSAAPAPKVAAANGTRKSHPHDGYSFAVPGGWTAQEAGQGFQLSQGDPNSMIVIVPHAYDKNGLRQALLSSAAGEEGVTWLSGPSAYGDNGMCGEVRLSGNGQTISMGAVALVSPHGGGVLVSAIGTPGAYSADLYKLAKSVASSIQFSAPKIAPIAQQWQQKIKGKQLLYLYTGNGLSDKWSYDLCPNGRYVYRSNSSYSSGGYADFSYAGQDGAAGRWRVTARGNEAYLVLQSDNGEVSEFAISARQAGNEIGLNQKRYFLQASQYCE